MVSVPRSPDGVKQTPVPPSPRTPPLGYAYLEAWASACSPQSPVYALLSSTSDSGPSGLGLETWTLTVQQADAQGGVHYWRMIAATVQTHCGQPFGAEQEARREAARSLWPLVLAWLCEAGYIVIEATYALPANLKYLTGSANFLSLDKNAMRYTRKG